MDDNGEWREHALCRGMDPDKFHPERWAQQKVRDAKAVCAKCPVATDCLEYALKNAEKIGIWGGTSEVERVRIRRQRGINYSDNPRYYPKFQYRQRVLDEPKQPSSKPKEAVCGTPGGYEKHRKNHQTPCAACKEANRLKTIHYRNLKK